MKYRAIKIETVYSSFLHVQTTPNEGNRKTLIALFAAYQTAVIAACATVAQEQAECWNDGDSGRLASNIIKQAILAIDNDQEAR